MRPFLVKYGTVAVRDFCRGLEHNAQLRQSPPHSRIAMPRRSANLVWSAFDASLVSRFRFDASLVSRVFPLFAALQLRRSVRDFRQGQRTTQHCRFSLHQKTCEAVDLCLNPACRTRSSPSCEASTPFGKGFLQLSVHLDFPGGRPWLPTGVYRHCSQQRLFCSFGPVILKGEP
jgi:hypothetical protein